LLETPQDFERFANAIDGLALARPNRETAIGTALIFSNGLLNSNSYRANRQVVDISGNGRNSDGPAVSEALAVLSENDITINGLILPAADRASDGDDTISDYFWQEVVAGEGSFALSIESHQQYTEAILRKLVLEVAWNE